MELSSFTLKLIILLVPGALGAIILERLTIHKKEWSSFKFIVNSVLIGLFAYALDEMVVRLVNLYPDFYLNHVSIFEGLANAQDNAIPWGEVLIASFTGVIIGFVFTRADRKKWLNKFARRWGFSDKYGDENLFSYYLSEQSEYVYVRCSRQGFTYKGLIHTFAETDEMKELFMKDVVVYDYASSEKLYEVAEIYLSLLKDDLVIELPKLVQNPSPENEQQTDEQQADEQQEL